MNTIENIIECKGKLKLVIWTESDKPLTDKEKEILVLNLEQIINEKPIMIDKQEVHIRAHLFLTPKETSEETPE